MKKILYFFIRLDTAYLKENVRGQIIVLRPLRAIHPEGV